MERVLLRQDGLQEYTEVCSGELLFVVGGCGNSVCVVRVEV